MRAPVQMKRPRSKNGTRSQTPGAVEATPAPAPAGRPKRVRNRLVAGVALVGITVLAAGAPAILAASAELTDSQRLVTLAELDRQAVTLAHSLADERDEVVAYIAAGRDNQSGDAKHKRQITSTRSTRVDRQIDEIRPAASAELRRDLAGIPSVRRNALTKGTALEAHRAYSEAITKLQALAEELADKTPARAADTSLTALVDQVPLTSLADISISRHAGSVLLIWRVEDESARLASLLQHAQRLGRVGAFEEDALTGDITWHGQLFELFGRRPTEAPVALRDLVGHAHPDDSGTIRRFLKTVLHQRQVGSAAFRMLRRDGVTRHIRVTAEPALGVDGGLEAVRGAYQDISAQHWTEVALTATRDRLVATEEAAEERNRLTLQLQHAIMPPVKPPLDAPDLEVAVRYRPAESESLVGGDWYDAVVLPSKKVLLCVGDVAGHGVEAATGMVVLRNALRGLAVTGAGPGQLLSWLNSVAHHLTAQVTATAVCGIFDPSTRTLRWARAGHLPPVLVRGKEAVDLPLLRGLLLGALAEAEYEEAELRLEPDDIVLMYTDGLVERRDTPVEDSVAQLLTMAQQPSDSLEQRLDQLLARSKSDTDDDTCVVGVQVS